MPARKTTTLHLSARTDRDIGDGRADGGGGGEASGQPSPLMAKGDRDGGGVAQTNRRRRGEECRRDESRVALPPDASINQRPFAHLQQTARSAPSPSTCPSVVHKTTHKSATASAPQRTPAVAAKPAKRGNQSGVTTVTPLSPCGAGLTSGRDRRTPARKDQSRLYDDEYSSRARALTCSRSFDQTVSQSGGRAVDRSTDATTATVIEERRGGEMREERGAPGRDETEGVETGGRMEKWLVRNAKMQDRQYGKGQGRTEICRAADGCRPTVRTREIYDRRQWPCDRRARWSSACPR